MPLTALLLGLSLASCRLQPPGQTVSTEQVAKAFVSKVVLPNSNQLVTDVGSLQVALQRFTTKPNEANLEAARQAWLTARRTWETSESWAFGPAETEGFDAAMDSWPVNRKDLASALAGPPLTETAFRSLSETAKGFHGIEWVLFGGQSGKRPSASEISANQRRYLVLAADDLHRQAKGLLTSWSGPAGFGARISTPDEAPTAVQELLQGVIGLLQEEGDEKLGQPLKTRDPHTLESADSGNTQPDLLANIEGARLVLIRSGLLELIRDRDASLAKAIDTQTAEAISMARALPHPINGQLDNPIARRAMEQLIGQLHRSSDLVKRAVPLLG